MSFDRCRHLVEGCSKSFHYNKFTVIVRKLKTPWAFFVEVPEIQNLWKLFFRVLFNDFCQHFDFLLQAFWLSDLNNEALAAYISYLEALEHITETSLSYFVSNKVMVLSLNRFSNNLCFLHFYLLLLYQNNVSITNTKKYKPKNYW